MSQAYEQLSEFLARKMRMSHIYQPVMLEVLLAKGGSASIREIATAFLAHDESQAEYYEQVVKRMPSPVLSRHGIVQRTGERYALTSHLAELTDNERAELVLRCREAVEAFKVRRGAGIWEHRRPGSALSPAACATRR
jgi:ATP adenylyltransferase